MIKIKYISLVIFMLSLYATNAQQMPQYSQYLRNQYMINPGAAGVYDFVDVTVAGRLQWAGFSDAPMTTYASFTSVLGSKDKKRYNPGLHMSTGIVKNPEILTGKLKQAVGGQLVADQYGAFRKFQLSGTYAIHLPITKDYNLSFGTKVGIGNNAFLQDRAVVANATTVVDNTYTGFTSNQGNVNILNLGAGFYFYSSKLFLGISADQLTRDLVKFGSGTANFDPKVHMNITGGLKLPLNENLTITPAFLVKYMNPTKPSIEGTAQLEYKEWLWTAFSYRHKDAVVGMVGMNISNRFKFGYSYDFSISQFRTYSSGGHELVLGIMLR
jgi:type IX secretion system PorP/SprF family membrane protein